MALQIDTTADLTSWRVMNKKLSTYDEAQCKALLAAEQAGERRVPFLNRIYGRYATLRAKRERAELAK